MILGYRSTNAYYDKSEMNAKSIKNPMNYDFIFVLAIGWEHWPYLDRQNQEAEGQ